MAITAIAMAIGIVAVVEDIGTSGVTGTRPRGGFPPYRAAVAAIGVSAAVRGGAVGATTVLA